MAEPVAIWHADHVVFARLLDLFESQVEAFHAGERPNYELMTEIVDYLRQYGDRFHHPREEVAFERLVERDPGMRLPVKQAVAGAPRHRPGGRRSAGAAW